jgi:phosphate transport system permease protein
LLKYPPMSAVPLDAAAPADDVPRAIHRSVSRGDRIFRSLSGAAAATSLLIIGTTAIYLAWQARPAFASAGWINFFTTSAWNASVGKFGVFGLLVGTVLIASIALMVAVPLAIGLALFVNEYAPARVRRFLISGIDLLAALPSLIFGIWGLFALQGPLRGWAQWFADHLSAIPFFRTDEGILLTKSGFVAGVVVGLMILPIITSVTRDVMAQCPRDHCEGALALGGTRWGMIRSVILPFARSGTVGAVLLGFGRALGETIAVTVIIALQIPPNTRVLTQGGGSIAALIATKFGEAQGLEVSALVAAGFALFLMTLVVNLGASRITRKARAALA